MTRGGSSADIILTTFDGETVSGLDGADTLSSTFNNTALLGGNDGDLLTTTYIHTVPGAEFFHDAKLTQLGGAGDDTLQASFDIDGDYAANATALQNGGIGNDVIRSNATVLMTGDASI